MEPIENPLLTTRLKGMRKDLHTPEDKAEFLYPRHGTLKLYPDRVQFDQFTIPIGSIVSATIFPVYSRLLPLHVLWIEAQDSTWIFGPHLRRALELEYPFTVEYRWAPPWVTSFWCGIAVAVLTWMIVRSIK